jgi:hypothetical protein
MAAQPKSDALRALYWREEILQVMFWLRGEGLGERVNWRTIERFLGVAVRIGSAYLDRLVEEGFLTTEGDWFMLTPKGVEEGGRIFSEEFADLTRPGHGQCGPDCWCHSSPDEAEACLAERAPGR